MRPLLLIAFTPLLLLAFTPGNTQPVNTSAISKQQMQADYDTLCAALREAHSGLYRYKTRKQVDQHFSHYRAKIESIENKTAFIRLVCEMLSPLGDGHMRPEFDEELLSAYSKAKLFPFQIAIEKNRLFVSFNESSGHSFMEPGTEILRINGLRAPDIIQAIFKRLPGDGYITTGKKKRVESAFPSFYWLLVDQSENFTIVARDKNAQFIRTRIGGVETNARGNNRSNNAVNKALQEGINQLAGPPQVISLRVVDDKTAVLRVRHFSEPAFNVILDSLWMQLPPVNEMILDLRGNGGGRDEMGAYLASKFVDKPFRYFEQINMFSISPSFASLDSKMLASLKNNSVAIAGGGYRLTPAMHSCLYPVQADEKPFTGKLVVLIDGSTFSTAADVAAQLRNRPNTIFVGEETGGGYQGNTSGLSVPITLPNSKLRVRIQMYDYWNAVPARKKGRGTMPDYPVENRIKEIEKGIDSQWETATRLLSSKL